MTRVATVPCTLAVIKRLEEANYDNHKGLTTPLPHSLSLREYLSNELCQSSAALTHFIVIVWEQLRGTLIVTLHLKPVCAR